MLQIINFLEVFVFPGNLKKYLILIGSLNFQYLKYFVLIFLLKTKHCIVIIYRHERTRFYFNHGFPFILNVMNVI